MDKPMLFPLELRCSFSVHEPIKCYTRLSSRLESGNTYTLA